MSQQLAADHLTEHQSLELILRDFLNANSMLLKILSIHQSNNEALKRPLSEIDRCLQALKSNSASKASVQIKVDEGKVLIMEMRMKPHFSITEALLFIPEIFEMGMLEAIEFSPNLDLSALVDFFSKLAQHANVHTKAKAFNYQVNGIETQLLDPKKAEQQERSKELLMDPAFALHHHYMFRMYVDRFFYGFASNTVISQKNLRRELMELAQIGRVAPYNLLALTFIEEKEGLSLGLSPAIHQAISTSLLCMILGREIGFSINDQVNLGLVGLLYNVGLLGEAQAIVQKQENLTAEEYQRVISAQSAGVYKLLKAQGKSRPVLERLLAIFEYSQGNQENSGLNSGLTLDSKLLSLCSRYIALISERPHRSAYLKDEALKILGKDALKKGAKEFDTILFYFLVQFLGVYPVGSVVQVSDGRKAIVFRPSGKKRAVPVLKILSLENPEEFQVLDLSESPDLKIVKSLSPEEEGIAISAFFFRKEI